MIDTRIAVGTASGGLTDYADFTYDGNLSIGSGGISLTRTGDPFVKFTKGVDESGQIRADGTYIKFTSDSGAIDRFSVNVNTGAVMAQTSFDVPEISNTAGLLKIQPDIQGDVEVFGDTDVADADSGKILKIWRRAVEGNDYIRFYIAGNQTAFIHTSCPLTLQAQQPFTIYSVTDSIYFKVGDAAGAKKFYFRNINNDNVVTIDSNGNITVDGTVDGRSVATDGTKLDGIAPSATIDQTGAEIKTAYEAEASAYTDTKDTKLTGIDTGAEVSTKEFFISAGAAILSTNASYPTPNDTYHLALADAVTFARCFFVFHLPSDFSGMASGYPKVVFKQGTGGTGNYRIIFNARAGGVGEQMGNALDSIAEYTMTAPGQGNELWEEDISACFDGLSLTAGDSVGLQIQRDSDDALDTFVGDLDVVGVVIKY